MKVACVIVAYNPDKQLFNQVIKSVQQQVDSLYIIDNSSYINEGLEFKNILYKKLKCNVGIAKAQNIGLEYYLNCDYDAILFLDQDSLLPIDFVNKLKIDLFDLCMHYSNVAGIGPIPVNRQNGKSYFNENKDFFPFQKVDHLMNSGSLIFLKCFKEVGLMNENLFIDGVDCEWCWRAKKMKNYDFYITKRISFEHQLGEGDRKFLFVNLAISSTFRIYYQYRNYVALCKIDYVPLKWKIVNLFKYFLKIIYYPLFVNPRIKYLSRIFCGIFDGLGFKLK